MIQEVNFLLDITDNERHYHPGEKIPLIYTDKIPKFLYLCNLFQKFTNGK